MTVTIRSFDDCIAMAGQGKRHLMLGNGFSVSLFPNIFNYRTLAQNIRSDRIRNLFAAIDTPDFEFVMRRIFEAAQIVAHYEDSQELQARLHGDIEELKQTLIQVITESHPPIPAEITEEQYLSCHQFLSHFNGNKFTFNYDLLLYWVLMHFKDNDELKLSSDDGFRYEQGVAFEDNDLSLHWQIGREHGQNLYYIHGAMHIFSDGSDIEKLSYNQIGRPLAEQVQEAVAQDKFPVFISEGTTEHKLARIMKNGYLSRTFSSLKGIRGSLFVFGHSLGEADDHVFDFINQTNTGLRNIFIGVFGDPAAANNQFIIRKVEGWRETYPRKTYELYNAASAQVWSRPMAQDGEL